jgi:hypothetical protein
MRTSRLVGIVSLGGLAAETGDEHLAWETLERAVEPVCRNVASISHPPLPGENGRGGRYVSFGKDLTMPLVSGGPPQWIWERTPDPLKWEILPYQDPNGHTIYEVRVNCGLEIMRLQFFAEEELAELQSLIDRTLHGATTSSNR